MMIDSFTGKYRFLSNFYPIVFCYDDHWFQSVEHFYQAMKSTDKKDWERITNLPLAKDAKKVGRRLKLRDDWEKVKDRIMLEGLILKFQHKELREKLINTHPLPLVEGNYWHDNYWGHCTCGHCSNIAGRNRLGTLLMKVRKFYRGDRC